MSTDPCALLVIDKPTGITSHDVVDRVRTAGKIARCGHAGTLDPSATGVLVLCIGSATRLAEYLLGHDKRYRATLRLGVETDTLDAEGTVVAQSDAIPAAEAVQRVEAVLERFRGEIEQAPPAYSAVRIDGQRAYARARRGEAVEPKPRRVTIRELQLVEYAPPDAVVDLACSAGTYVRALARDVGRALGCGAHLATLQRTRAGAFSVESAIPLDAALVAAREGALERHLIAPEVGLAEWPELRLDAEGEDAIRHGRPIIFSGAAGAGGVAAATLSPDQPLRIHGAAGTMFAVGAVEADGRTVWPVKVIG